MNMARVIGHDWPVKTGVPVKRQQFHFTISSGAVEEVTAITCPAKITIMMNFKMLVL